MTSRLASAARPLAGQPPSGPSWQLGGPTTEDLVRRYLAAKRFVIDAGYAAEIAWQTHTRISEVTSCTFVREAAWVILSAGMRESVVRRRFPALTAALHNFQPAAIAHDPDVRNAALGAFHHERKIDAVLAIAALAHRMGTHGIRRSLVDDPARLLQRLPYMGPAVSRHLAKNLGLPVAKPDRHLVRLASAAARTDPDHLCAEIAHWLGDPIAVVDIVLWRWATLHQGRCTVQACDGLPHP
jgi:hypothetical protein